MENSRGKEFSAEAIAVVLSGGIALNANIASEYYSLVGHVLKDGGFKTPLTPFIANVLVTLSLYNQYPQLTKFAPKDGLDVQNLDGLEEEVKKISPRFNIHPGNFRILSERDYNEFNSAEKAFHLANASAPPGCIASFVLGPANIKMQEIVENNLPTNLSAEEVKDLPEFKENMFSRDLMLRILSMAKASEIGITAASFTKMRISQDEQVPQQLGIYVSAHTKKKLEDLLVVCGLEPYMKLAKVKGSEDRYMLAIDVAKVDGQFEVFDQINRISDALLNKGKQRERD